MAENMEVRCFNTIEEARQDIMDSGRACDGIKVLDGPLLGAMTLPCGKEQCAPCLGLNQVMVCTRCKAFMRRSSTACPGEPCVRARAEQPETNAGVRTRTSRNVRSIAHVRKGMEQVCAAKSKGAREASWRCFTLSRGSLLTRFQPLIRSLRMSRIILW
jgi:hypothetical protein